VIRVLQYHLRTYDITYAILQAKQKLQDFVLTAILADTWQVNPRFWHATGQSGRRATSNESFYPNRFNIRANGRSRFGVGALVRRTHSSGCYIV